MMELQLLCPHNRQKGSHFKPNQTQHKSLEECRQWKANGGFCRFGENCRYKHVPIIRNRPYENTIPKKQYSAQAPWLHNINRDSSLIYEACYIMNPDAVNEPVFMDNYKSATGDKKKKS